MPEKGYGIGHWDQGKMGVHGQKKLEAAALLAFRDRFDLALSDAEVTSLRFYRSPADSPEMKYLHACRQALGGHLPARPGQGPARAAPALSAFARLL